jgi:hypothetical protein
MAMSGILATIRLFSTVSVLLLCIRAVSLTGFTYSRMSAIISIFVDVCLIIRWTVRGIITAVRWSVANVDLI